MIYRNKLQVKEGKLRYDDTKLNKDNAMLCVSLVKYRLYLSKPLHILK